MRSIKIIVGLAIAVLLASCNKNETVFKAYFYSSDAKRTLDLYIDGENKGQLPYVDCHAYQANELQKAKMLFMNLPSGKYKLSVKDENGTVVSECKEFKIVGKRGKLSQSMRGGTGGQESSATSEEVITNLFSIE